MPVFTWHRADKKVPECDGTYVVYHKNGVIEMSVWNCNKSQWAMHATQDSPITHWTDYKKLGKPFSYNG